jgi:hypothetical protein
VSPIDAYLAELRRALRFHPVRRHRLLAEVKSHLRESTDALRGIGHAADEAEREAVARFGSPSAVASEAVRAAGPVGLLWASLLLLGALALYLLPLYAIPENTLPPPTWAERPGYLTWKLYAALGAYGLATGAGLVALGAALRGYTRATLIALLTSTAAFAVSGVVGTVLAVQWADAVPGSGTTLALTLLATAAITAFAAGAVILAMLYRPPSARSARA